MHNLGIVQEPPPKKKTKHYIDAFNHQKKSKFHSFTSYFFYLTVTSKNYTFNSSIHHISVVFLPPQTDSLVKWVVFANGPVQS